MSHPTIPGAQKKNSLILRTILVFAMVLAMAAASIPGLSSSASAKNIYFSEDSSAASSAEISEEEFKVIEDSEQPDAPVPVATVVTDASMTAVLLEDGDTISKVMDRLNIEVNQEDRNADIDEINGEDVEKLNSADIIKLNGKKVPKKKWDKTLVNPGDSISLTRVEVFGGKHVEYYDYDRYTQANPNLSLGDTDIREGKPGYYGEVYEYTITENGKPKQTKREYESRPTVDEITYYGTKVYNPEPGSLSISKNYVITNRDEREKNITLKNGDTLDYRSISYSFNATAYTGGGYCYSGCSAHVGHVAVDPSVIPLGTRMYIATANGSVVYGECIATDTGVHGHLIDLYFNTEAQCRAFGVRDLVVYFLD